jgi:plastocyanin
MRVARARNLNRAQWPHLQGRQNIGAWIIAVTGLAKQRGSIMRHVAMALLLVLAPCATPVQAWSQAAIEVAAAPETIVIRLASFAFTPDHLRLRVGMPVRLQFVNESSGAHNFSAPAFFAASNFAPGSSPPPDGKLEVAERSTAELTLTPRVAGSFPVKCSHFLHSLFGMTGTIVVMAPAG